MSVTRRSKLISGQRFDIPHVRSLESSISSDFDSLARGVFTGLTQPLLVRGFDILASTAIKDTPVQNMQLRVADSVILHSTATESGTVLSTATDEADIQLNPGSNDKILGGWVAGTTNYVGIDYRRKVDNSTVDLVAAWSPTEKIELQKSVPTGYTLDFVIVISTSGFGNSLPLFKVQLNASKSIIDITNCKPYFFRLATGGTNPDPSYSYPWTTRNTDGTRVEGGLVQEGLTVTDNPWSVGDFGIKNMKEAFDAVFTRFKEITGSSLWYADTALSTSPIKLKDLWWDSNSSVMTANGAFSFDLLVQTNAQFQTAGDSVNPDPADPATTTRKTVARQVSGNPVYTVRAFSYSAGLEVGRGLLKYVDGTQWVIGSISGSFAAANQIRLKIQVPADQVTWLAGVATINLTAITNGIGAAIFSPTGATSGTFIGTVRGCSDENFNKEDEVMTITSASTIDYAVPGAGLITQTGAITLDGVLVSAPANYSANITVATAGPFRWSSDISVRSIVGNKKFTLSSTATAPAGFDIFGPGSVAFQDDQQVAYIELDRDLIVGGSGATYNIISGVVSGPVMNYLDSDSVSQVIAVGDYLKISNESESRWFRVGSVNNVLAPTLATLVDDITNLTVSTTYRPDSNGVKITVSRGTYSNIKVAYSRNVPDSGNVYWIAMRKDKSSSPTIYLRQMELEVGETRQINDNQTTNILQYIGAPNESTTTPNYSLSAQGTNHDYSQTVTVNGYDRFTNTVYLTDSPGFGIQQGDEIIVDNGANFQTLTVAFPLDVKTFAVNEEINALATTGNKTYRRPNSAMEDVDNLTKATRKIDRFLNRISTILNRPVYDESVYVQKIDISVDVNSGNPVLEQPIRSGYYITASGSRLAWVLASSNDATSILNREVRDEFTGTLENNKLLIHAIYGDWSTVTGFGINQTVPGKAAVTRTANSNAYDTRLYGDPVSPAVAGQILRLPPNTRVQLPDNTLVGPTAGKVYPFASYNTRNDDKGGGELMIITNDQVRECGIDFLEDTLQIGPARYDASADGILNRSTIKLMQSQPLATRIRFRNLSTFGLPPTGLSGTTSLQGAYLNGRLISTSNPLTPVDISPVSGNPTDTVLSIFGRITLAINAGGGIAPASDKYSNIGFEPLRFANMWSQQQNIKTHDNVSGSELKLKTEQFQTVGAALQNAVTISTTTSRAYRFNIKAVGRRQAGGPDSASFKIEVMVYNEGSGATIDGFPITTVIGSTSGAGAYALTCTTSGNNFIIQLAGDIGHTVQWALTIEEQSVSTAV